MSVWAYCGFLAFFSSFAGINLELTSFSVCLSLTFSLPPHIHSHSIQCISYSLCSIQFCVKSIFFIIKPTWSILPKCWNAMRCHFLYVSLFLFTLFVFLCLRIWPWFKCIPGNQVFIVAFTNQGWAYPLSLRCIRNSIKCHFILSSDHRAK